MPIVKMPVVRRIMLNLPKDEDPEQTAYVEVRQATQREVERRASIGAETSRIYRDNSKEMEVKYNWTYTEQMRLETYITLADCNIEIPDPDDPEAKKTIALFRFRKDGAGKMKVDMNEAQFSEAWGILPEPWAIAIHKAVLKVNPQWDPEFRPE